MREVHANALRLVGGTPVVWAPISPLSRRNLIESFQGLPDAPAILDEDWTNLLFVEDWGKAPARNPRPVIGRHSRPDWPKWPASVDELLMIYPDDPGYEVRLLGAGDGLQKLLQGRDKPANWTALPFGAMEPAEFLREVDFFVYYHHPDWVEGFGRTIAEAMASGCVVILPEHFRATFAEAALYRSPEQVRATIDELWADPEWMDLQGRIARRWIAKHYGPDRYLDRIRRVLDQSPAASIDGAPRPGSDPAPSDLPDMFDVLRVGDFTLFDETAFRVADEVRIENELGLATGLLHLPRAGSKQGDKIHPEIQALIEENRAVAVDPTLPRVATRLLILHRPDRFAGQIDEGRPVPLPRINAQQTVVLYDQATDDATLRRKDALIRAMFGRAVWAPTSKARRDELIAAGIPVDPVELWGVSVACGAPPGGASRQRDVVVIGRTSTREAADWPKDEAAILAAWPNRPNMAVRILGAPAVPALLQGKVPGHWTTFPLSEMPVDRFLANLDAVVHLTDGSGANLPLQVLARAAALGKPILGTADVAAALGGVVKTVKPEQVVAQVSTLVADESSRLERAREQARLAQQMFGPSIHQRRLRRLIGELPARIAAPAALRKARKRALFVSSNGVGLGHLTRLLAIARRMPGDIEPVFLTMSQAIPIVRQSGYHAEYLPFHASAGCDPDAWNPWFAEHLGQVLDYHGAETVVFDGGMPYQGLIKALARRAATRLVWVRRGMWKETQNNDASIRRQHFFDLIIEPTDIAEAIDTGATAAYRAFARKVAPIRYLDDEELLSREDACRRLGLDPTRPSCLIQLGSGSNRDIVSMINTVLDRLHAVPGMQAVIAEWLISPNQLDFWPGVQRLRGFPLSLYFRAFDFTVSAAGYNSFNEIISFGLPAVFMANDHAMMDDQAGRARYAQDNDAAFHLPDNRPDAIGPMIEALLDPKIRMRIEMNCQRIALGNGAADAAALIAALG